MCYKTCFDVSIDDDTIAQAQEDEIHLREQHKNSKRKIPLNDRRDFFGSIAQNLVIDQAENGWGIALEEKTSYFDSSIYGDTCDFVYAGQKCDVQGSPLTNPKYLQVHATTTFLINNEKEEKPMDKYILCKINLPARILHICGVVGYYEVWENDIQVKNPPDVPHPCHFVYCYQLKSFREYLFR